MTYGVHVYGVSPYGSDTESEVIVVIVLPGINTTKATLVQPGLYSANLVQPGLYSAKEVKS